MIFGRSVYNLVYLTLGLMFPAYASIEALETPQNSDDVFWLTYWIVFSMCAVIENIADSFLWVVPLYYLCKIIFRIYCLIPGENNATTLLYEKMVYPLYLEMNRYFEKALL